MPALGGRLLPLGLVLVLGSSLGSPVAFLIARASAPTPTPTTPEDPWRFPRTDPPLERWGEREGGRGRVIMLAVDGLDWDVAALPTAVEPAGILHSDAYCMAAAAEDKDAAWTFIEYANSSEGQAIVAESGRTVPSLKEVASSEAFLDPSVAPANSAVWLETVDTLGTVPVMAAWVDIEELTGDELERAFYGQATVDEVIDAMITRTAPFFAGEEG